MTTYSASPREKSDDPIMISSKLVIIAQSTADCVCSPADIFFMTERASGRSAEIRRFVQENTTEMARMCETCALCPTPESSAFCPETKQTDKTSPQTVQDSQRKLFTRTMTQRDNHTDLCLPCWCPYTKGQGEGAASMTWKTTRKISEPF